MCKEIIIIGAGPAGVSTAIQLRREGLEPLILEQDKVGGLLWNANLIENYPGFPDGISGKKLAWLFSEQLKRLNIKVKKQRVKHISLKEGIFEIETEAGSSAKTKFLSRLVVVATGTVPKKINLPGAEDNSGKNLFYEITQLPSIKGRKIIILGGGDVAFDYALNLVSSEVDKRRRNSERDCGIDLVFRDFSPRCLPILWERAKKSKKINLLSDITPLRVRGEGGKIFLDCRFSQGSSSAEPEKEFTLFSDYILVAIGRIPNIDFLSDELRSMYLQKDRPGRQKISGIFFSGDVINGDYRQVGIAVGDGLACGMSISRLLKKERFNI